MDVRWASVLALSLLAGCAGDAPDADGAGDGGGASARLEEADQEGRRSRPGGASAGVEDEPARDPFEPYPWSGETDSAACVDVTLGCAGVTMYGSPSAEVPFARGVSLVRVTISWTPVDASTEELYVRAGNHADARGPSPLVLDVRPTSGFEVYVEAPRDLPLRVVPHQPFKGVAEYS